MRDNDSVLLEDAYISLYKSILENKEIYNDISPISPDDVYHNAVETGDMEKVQFLVDEAAKKAGYNVGPVFHGTNSDYFTTFDSSKAKVLLAGKGFYFTNSKRISSRYGKNVISVYLRINDPIINDENGNLVGVRGTDEGDSRWIKGGFPGTNKGEEIFLVRSPNQIKSADPTTYDNKGILIPLSQRFNSQSKDIRY